MSAPLSSLKIVLPDATATDRAGALLAPPLRGGMTVWLQGDLGAGKTTLVRACLRALGWSGSVKSPTYTLVEHYPLSSLYCYHFDFYRFNDPDEWETAGFAECFRVDALCLVEWPERVAGLLPVPDLVITLSHRHDADEGGRDCIIEAHTEAGERCRNVLTAMGRESSP